MTDGSVRDTGVLRDYGFPVFSISTTPRQGPHAHQPWSCNTVINCGGGAVRLRDAIVGDDDGCVVIPAAVAQEVYDIAHSREVVEDIVKEELSQNPGPPGKYYPFVSARSSPTPPGQAPESKGHDPKKFAHTAARPAPAPASASPAPPAAASSPAPALPATTPPLPTLATTTRRRLRRRGPSQVCGAQGVRGAAHAHRGRVHPAMDAAVAGGFKLAEFTPTTPGASTPSRSTRALAPMCSPAWALS